MEVGPKDGLTGHLGHLLFRGRGPGGVGDGLQNVARHMDIRAVFISRRVPVEYHEHVGIALAIIDHGQGVGLGIHDEGVVPGVRDQQVQIPLVFQTEGHIRHTVEDEAIQIIAGDSVGVHKKWFPLEKDIHRNVAIAVEAAESVR